MEETIIYSMSARLLIQLPACTVRDSRRLEVNKQIPPEIAAPGDDQPWIIPAWTHVSFPTLRALGPKDAADG
jgi:hypothetical protein